MDLQRIQLALCTVAVKEVRAQEVKLFKSKKFTDFGPEKCVSSFMLLFLLYFYKYARFVLWLSRGASGFT